MASPAAVTRPESIAIVVTTAACSIAAGSRGSKAMVTHPTRRAKNILVASWTSQRAEIPAKGDQRQTQRLHHRLLSEWRCMWNPQRSCRGLEGVMKKAAWRPRPCLSSTTSCNISAGEMYVYTLIGIAAIATASGPSTWSNNTRTKSCIQNTLVIHVYKICLYLSTYP